MNWEKLWDELYAWINNTRLSVAPDETTSTDECADRMAQLDILDGILKWMNTEEVARMSEVRE